jgi:hypothetical protein
MDSIEADEGPHSAPEEKMASANTAVDVDAISCGPRQSLLTRPRLRLVRRFLNGFGITLALSWVVMHCLEALNDDPVGLSHYTSGFIDWNHRREEVKQAFVTSWDAYAQHAWGK